MKFNFDLNKIININQLFINVKSRNKNQSRFKNYFILLISRNIKHVIIIFELNVNTLLLNIM